MWVPNTRLWRFRRLLVLVMRPSQRLLVVTSTPAWTRWRRGVGWLLIECSVGSVLVVEQFASQCAEPAFEVTVDDRCS